MIQLHSRLVSEHSARLLKPVEVFSVPLFRLLGQPVSMSGKYVCGVHYAELGELQRKRARRSLRYPGALRQLSARLPFLTQRQVEPNLMQRDLVLFHGRQCIPFRASACPVRRQNSIRRRSG
jgi:hypothetical protein